MPARVSRCSFLGAAGAATHAAAQPERTVEAVPVRAALRDTAHLYERPS